MKVATSAAFLAATLALAACAGQTPVPRAERVDAVPRNIAVSPAGIFLDHGLMVNPMSASAIGEVTTWLQQRGFIYQFQNVTALRPDGTMDPANYSQLAHWIAVSRKRQPQQKIIVYVSGSLALVNTKSAWPNVAALAKTFVQKYGADGVNLDFEPYRPRASNYIGLFRAVRKAIGSQAMMSLDYTADVRYAWSPNDYRAISGYFDRIMPMLYDSSCKTAACYRKFVSKAVAYESQHLAAGTALYPLIPAYAKSRYHDPSVENICAAMDGIRQTGASYDSAGVWWYFGWNAAAERDWKRCGPAPRGRD